MLEAYGVWVEKNMYGGKYMGIERATFLIGEDGKILNIWRKVHERPCRRRAGGHPRVSKSAQSLNSGRAAL